MMPARVIPAAAAVVAAAGIATDIDKTSKFETKNPPGAFEGRAGFVRFKNGRTNYSVMNL
jgi:hypothetical protein